MAQNPAHTGFGKTHALLVLMALGVIGNGVYQLLFIQGMSRTSVGNAALIIAVAWLVLSEVPTAWQGIGTATIMTGLFLTRS